MKIQIMLIDDIDCWEEKKIINFLIREDAQYVYRSLITQLQYILASLDK